MLQIAVTYVEGVSNEDAEFSCNADFNNEDPNLMIGIFLVLESRASQIIHRILLLAYIFIFHCVVP